MTLEPILLILVSTPIFIQTILLLIPYRDQHRGHDDEEGVSVLLAVRNEEKSIAGCLDSLVVQDYPKEKLEIIVGDDRSDDRTAEIVNEYIDTYPEISIRIYSIEDRTSSSIGKANVLSQLAELANGAYFLITDADTRPGPGWIRNVIAEMAGNSVDLFVGTTTVSGSSLFDRMQDYEWIMTLGIMKSISDLGFPVTGLGNNMAIRKEPYFDTGGYKALPDSITEDFALVKRFKVGKFRIVNGFNNDVLAETDPVGSFSRLLNQRKRWMRGAFRLNPVFVIVLLIFSLYPVFLTGLLIVNPNLGAPLLIGKFSVTQGMLMKSYGHLGKTYKAGTGIVFEIFWELFWLISLVYYLLPVKIEWKGRHYK